MVHGFVLMVNCVLDLLKFQEAVIFTNEGILLDIREAKQLKTWSLSPQCHTRPQFLPGQDI